MGERRAKEAMEGVGDDERRMRAKGVNKDNGEEQRGREVSESEGRESAWGEAGKRGDGREGGGLRVQK